MTREEKKQAKIAEKEKKIEEKLAKKNNKFFKKLKAKIDELFASSKLTFCGKIFMLGLYACATSGLGIIAISALRSIINAILTLSGVTVKIPFLGGALGLCWLLFVITLIYVIVISIAEILTNAEGNNSLFEKEDEDSFEN